MVAWVTSAAFVFVASIAVLRTTGRSVVPRSPDVSPSAPVDPEALVYRRETLGLLGRSPDTGVREVVVAGVGDVVTTTRGGLPAVYRPMFFRGTGAPWAGESSTAAYVAPAWQDEGTWPYGTLRMPATGERAIMVFAYIDGLPTEPRPDPYAGDLEELAVATSQLDGARTRPILIHGWYTLGAEEGVAVDSVFEDRIDLVRLHDQVSQAWRP